MCSLVSVIVPVYNVEKYLEKCISSIRTQTYRDIEILLIDDGSSDRSGEICDRQAAEDARIQVVHISNHGVSHARNLGIQRSSGKYLFFVDSDDYIDNGMIADHVNTMEKACADLCISDFMEINVPDCFCIKLSQSNEFELLYLLQNNLLFGPMVKLYRRDLVCNNGILFPEDVSYGEDLLFNIRYLRYVEHLCYINRCYYHYVTENIESLSRKVRWNAFENDMMLHCELKNWLLQNNLLGKEVQKYLADRVVGTANDAIALIYRRDCHWNRLERWRYIRKILHNDLLAESLQFADTTAYAPWIIWGMRKRNSLLFWLRAYKR